MSSEAFETCIVIEEYIPREANFNLESLIGLSNDFPHSIVDPPVAKEPMNRF
jgi:hypothetical protein